MKVSAAGSRLIEWLEVDEQSEGQRIDNYLINHLKGVPKSFIYRILRRGEVRVNKGRIKPDYRLQSGDIVRVPPLRRPALVPAPVPGRRGGGRGGRAGGGGGPGRRGGGGPAGGAGRGGGGGGRGGI